VVKANLVKANLVEERHTLSCLSMEKVSLGSLCSGSLS